MALYDEVLDQLRRHILAEPDGPIDKATRWEESGYVARVSPHWGGIDDRGVCGLDITLRGDGRDRSRTVFFSRQSSAKAIAREAAGIINDFLRR